MPPLKTISRYHFIAEWGGNRVEFTEISGLEIYIDVISMRNGSSSENSELKIPGITKFPEIVLKRNIVQGDQQFFDWIRTNSFGTVERRDVVIRLLDYQHQPVMMWRVRNAFPSKYIGPVLLSGDSNLATESLVLSHDGLDLMK
ncbi:hypothetical protein FIC_01064 [Flavobacteriaceae bacterium 3519-10]|nr:hypothetical protein FIC_01064 [Flavobacteriaceae bacterium 3519-10]